MKANYKHSIFLVLASTLFLAFSNLCTKLAGDSLSVPWLVLFSSLLPFFVFLTMARKESFKRFFSTFRYDFLRALFAMIAQYLLVAYLVRSSLLAATLLYATGPLFVPVISRIFYHVKMNSWVLLCIVLSFFAIVLILHPSLTVFETPIWLGLGAGFFNAFSQVICHKATKNVPAKIHTFRMYAYSSLLCLIPVFFDVHHQIHNIMDADWSCVLLLLLLGRMLGSTMQQTLRAKAFTLVNKAASLAPFMYTSIIYAVFIDWAVFHQVPGVLTWSGILLFVVSGSMMVIKPRHKRLQLKRR